MPIYEEKLVSPLAIRFTQEHIKTIFRDGHVVEATVREIGTRAAGGDYDAILTFPFPPIEIIRFRPKGGDRDRRRDDPAPAPRGRHEERDGSHWFTLDNRRLYCLQRAAVARWPQRVAAPVEILYADPGTLRKKYDNRSKGCSVSISRSVRDPPISWWDWRSQVGGEGHDAATQLAFDAVRADDSKKSVDALLNLPRVSRQANSLLTLLRSPNEHTERSTNPGASILDIHSPLPSRARSGGTTPHTSSSDLLLTSQGDDDDHDILALFEIRELDGPRTHVAAPGHCHVRHG